jgi:serine/threonine protein kinase
MTDETIFATALEKANPAKRAAFLAEACGDDAARRKRLEGLLLAHTRAADFLERPPGGAPDPDPAATQGLTGTPDPGVAAAPTTDGKNGASDDEPLTFLAPPTREGALGRIGHYEVLQVLGRGGFGIVFRAFDETLQRVVALKVMAPQLAATSPARKRFLREARSSAQVRHENVVQVYEVAEQPLPYLAMEFIPGETLQQKLDRVGPLDVPETLRIGRQIAEGLAAAHATDLIHRDIKPGNVLLEGGQQKVKITDFGLARTADDASISQSGIIAGTPMYMAPAQAQGQTLDQRADLFSLGSVLYQMVAGRPPFRANTTVAVLKRVAEDKPRAIREIIPETPQWLCDIIARLHAKDPDDRYQSAREVADVLADCEAQLKANARLKDFSRIPRIKQPAAGNSGRWKWIAAAALLLPVLALALTEIAGVTHFLQKQQPPVAVAPNSDPRVKPETPLVAGCFALSFDGQKSLVKIPSLTLNDDHAFTAEVWAVLEDPVDRRKNFDLVCNAGDAGFALCVPPVRHGGDGRKIGFLMRLKSPDGYVRAWEKQPVPRNQLIHLAGVYDGKGEIRFYVNGRLQNCMPAQDVKPSNFPLTLGGNWHGSDKGSRFLGRMNEVRISTVARYDRDFTPIRRFEPDKDTIALYHCDEGEGAVLKDSSGNGHHGQIVGAKWVKADGSPISPPPAAQTPAASPFTDADVQRIAALPAAEQVEEVRKELKRRNPGFDGALAPTIEDDVVTGLAFSTEKVRDIAPVRALTRLRKLDIHGSAFGKGVLADLSPLKGMPLKWLNIGESHVSDLTPLTGMPLEWLAMWGWRGADLTPLKNMPLKWLNCGGGGQKLDLTSLAGMPLAYLCVNHTQVPDLTPLKDAPLRDLECANTLVSDVSPLQGIVDPENWTTS